MTIVSFLDFIKTKRFAEIGIGTTRHEIVSAIGPPPKWGQQNIWKCASYWQYSDIRFEFSDNAVRAISSDQGNLNNAGNSFKLAPWIIKRGLRLNDFIEALETENIPYYQDHFKADGSQVIVQVHGSIAFYFRTTNKKNGLFSWFYDEMLEHRRPVCDCFQPYITTQKKSPELSIHKNMQNRDCRAWKELLKLIYRTEETRQPVLDPKKELGLELWNQIETLPKEIGRLKHLKSLVLYRSNLSWLPPEIGQLESLVNLDTYTSYRLHWYPFELTNCKKLETSRVSTRALYGNRKNRAPFPPLKQSPVLNYADRVRCSICDKELSETELNQYWISLRVATDELPLLVNVCSNQCRCKIPFSGTHYYSKAHKGGKSYRYPKDQI